MGDLEPTPLSGSLEDQAIPANLDAAGGDFDMPVEDFFDLDPFPLDGMPLDGEDWVSPSTSPSASFLFRVGSTLCPFWRFRLSLYVRHCSLSSSSGVAFFSFL